MYDHYMYYMVTYRYIIGVQPKEYLPKNTLIKNSNKKSIKYTTESIKHDKSYINDKLPYHMSYINDFQYRQYYQQ